MSDEDTTQNDDVQETSEHDDETRTDELPDWARKQLEKANREAAKYRTQLRDLEPLAEKARELEEAQKSEQQKLAEAQQAAEERASRAESELLRMRVAVKHELPAELADRLRGDTEEDLEEDAKRLLELVGTPKKQPDLKQGVRTGDTPEDGNAWLRQMASR